MTKAGYIPIKATYYIKRNASGNPSYVVRYERHRVIKGKFTTKSFPEGEELRRDQFIAEWNSALAKNNSSELADLSSLQRSEIQVALKKLDGTGVSILQAVDYYLKMKNPVSSNMKISEAVEIFLNNLKAKKVGKNYLEDQQHSFLKPFQKYFRNKKITEISRRDMQKYLLANKNWSDNNRIIHRRHLSAFFNNLIKDEVLSLNPTQGVILPEVVVEKKFYSPVVVWLFLHTSLRLKKYKTLAAHALAAFGGCRLREATRIKFDQINGNGRIEIQMLQSKTRTRRILWNDQVLSQWFKMIPEEKKIGSICTEYSTTQDPQNVKKHMREHDGFEFDDVQNGFRQAFAAHYYKKYSDIRTLSEIMGNSEATIQKHYNGILKNENDAENYFGMYPLESLVKGLDTALAQRLWNKEYSSGVDGDDLMAIKRSDGSWNAEIYSKKKWEKYQTFKSRYDESTDPARIQRAMIVKLSNKDSEIFWRIVKFRDQYGFSGNDYEQVSMVAAARQQVESTLGCELTRML